jgi:hypothetical protein
MKWIGRELLILSTLQMYWTSVTSVTVLARDSGVCFVIAFGGWTENYENKMHWSRLVIVGLALTLALANSIHEIVTFSLLLWANIPDTGSCDSLTTPFQSSPVHHFHCSALYLFCLSQLWSNFTTCIRLDAWWWTSAGWSRIYRAPKDHTIRQWT